MFAQEGVRNEGERESKREKGRHGDSRGKGRLKGGKGKTERDPELLRETRVGD